MRGWSRLAGGRHFPEYERYFPPKDLWAESLAMRCLQSETRRYYSFPWERRRGEAYCSYNHCLPGAIRIPVATNPSGSYGSTSTIFGYRGPLSEMAPPGRPPRTPGEDPTGPGNEKIPRGDQGGASPPSTLLCGGAAIAGLVAGGIAYAGTQNSRLDYPAEGVAGGIFLCVVAYAKWH